MKIHEYQAKEILKKFDVAIPEGKLATTPEQAFANAKELGGNLWVVKAQIHAGGRGKGGGVKLAKSLNEVKELANTMLGMTLVTHQTGPEGKKVEKVYIEKGQALDKEYYVALILDRSKEQIAVIASREGGVEIEKVAHDSPDKIYTAYAPDLEGFRPAELEKLSAQMGFKGKTAEQFQDIVSKLFKTFIETDASIVEINPLVSTKDGNLLALDAKINFDDNALYKRPEIAALRDLTEEDPKEIEASKYRLNYISLNGNIGCMVNGAGLAMATMDVIKLHGGEPANFLDVGGGAKQQQVEEALKIILLDKNVKAILINIFGGIVRCDIIARGVLEATKHIQLTVPLIVRLQGNSAQEALKILNESGVNIITAVTMTEAAQKSVGALKR